MKKKSETTKNATAEAVAKDMPEVKAENTTNMSDEEFDRYIDGIMVEEQQEAIAETVDNQTVMAEEIQTLREDVDRLTESLNVLTGYIQGKEAHEPAQQPVPVSEADKAKLYDYMMEERKRFELIKNRMREQEEEIKKDFTDFDFKYLYGSDPGFKAEFDKSGSVYGAYLKYLARKLLQGERPGRSFVENGAMPAMAAGTVSTSPAGLPDKEFDEYIRNILGE